MLFFKPALLFLTLSICPVPCFESIFQPGDALLQSRNLVAQMLRASIALARAAALHYVRNAIDGIDNVTRE
jgi:hypothetical protein